ncbi:MAG TPA: hypothetical protein GXZ90_05410 [Clostridiales bacterium]|nr:hypothetical protein [Clostridiales bacterium]
MSNYMLAVKLVSEKENKFVLIGKVVPQSENKYYFYNNCNGELASEFLHFYRYNELEKFSMYECLLFEITSGSGTCYKQSTLIPSSLNDFSVVLGGEEVKGKVEQIEDYFQFTPL